MAYGRDLSHEAYQAPWIQRHGALVGGTILLVLAVLYVMFAKPFEDRGRPATVLVPSDPIRLSLEPNVKMVQHRPTTRVAINGAGVYVTWADTRSNPPSAVLAVSTDTGKSFTEHVLSAPTSGRVLSDPAVAVDSQGSIYLLYAYQRLPNAKERDAGEQSARIARSDDAGEHWTQVRAIQSAKGTHIRDAVMAFDGHDILHIAGLAAVGPAAQVVITKSPNRAESFEPESVVSSAGKGNRQDLAIATTPAGKVALVWSDLRDAPDAPENGVIYGSLSMDGTSFSPEQQLIKPALTPGRQRYPAVLFDDDGHLGVLFVEGTDQARRDRTELRYSHSTSNGQSFSEPVTLFAKELSNPSSPMMAAGVGGHWYLTCQGTMTDRGQPTAVIAQSTDAGGRWQALTPVVDRYSGFIKYPALAIQENTLVVSYFDYADPQGKPGTSECYAVRLEDEAVKP